MNTLFGIESPLDDLSNEWYTPAKYCQAARLVMGGPIDLDPASCALANQSVQATRFFSKKENGLLQTWDCAGRPSRLWLNPPYGKLSHNVGSLGIWIQKFLRELEAGHIAQAMLCVTSDPDERWFQPLWEYPVCFTVPRVQFSRPGKKPERQAFGTAFVYVGPHEARFLEIFSTFGIMARRIVASAQQQKEDPYGKVGHM